MMHRVLLIIFMLFARPGRGLELDYTLALAPQNQGHLIVALHGCDQTSGQFQQITNFTRLAHAAGFSVLYPNQEDGRHTVRCWNWYDRDPKSKAYIESEAIVNIIKKVRQQNTQLNGKVFVTGLSSGGAIAGHLATCYPALFTAAAIHSSVSYLRATNEKEGLQLMSKGSEAQLKVGKTCDLFQKIPLLVIQGWQDKLVHKSNADTLLVDLGEKDTSYAIMVPDLGHAWSGGRPGKYSNTATVNATKKIIQFFANF